MSALSPRHQQIRDFLAFCDRLKTIERQSYIGDGSRRETDAEHTWHMALFAILLNDELSQPADLGAVLSMIAVHDLVEILAGDTYAYDPQGQSEQADREARAADTLFATLPDDLRVRVRGLWEAFETGQSPEADFARGLDRLQALGQSVATGGRAWREHGVTQEQVAARMAPARKADPLLATLIDNLMTAAQRGEMWGRHQESNEPEREQEERDPLRHDNNETGQTEAGRSDTDGPKRETGTP